MSKKNSEIKLTDFIPEFVEAFTKQLEEDEKRWGDTFLKRTREGQEDRTIFSFNNTFDKFKNGKRPIHWLAIIGNAFICWVREEHPEIWPE